MPEFLIFLMVIWPVNDCVVGWTWGEMLERTVDRRRLVGVHDFGVN